MENSRFKFRAWNTETNKMIINLKEMGVFALQSTYSIDEFLVIPTNAKYPLMQYTGLLDKQGVEIYEGDIVKADCRSGHNKDNGKYIIEYDRTNCCFYGNPRPVIQLFGLMLDVIHCEPISDLRQNIEVIGNIYENPELLNK